ncbi:MAG: hypothetical protein AAGA85_09420 [Bacteroidota bacterium]
MEILDAVIRPATSRSRFVVPVLFLVISVSLQGCSEDTDEAQGLLLPPDVWQVEEIEGVVGYWDFDQVDRYFINVAVPGTIDSQVTGLIDEMPADFQAVGLRVTFSGRYLEETTNPRPMLGGQRVYSLELSSIRLAR